MPKKVNHSWNPSINTWLLPRWLIWVTLLLAVNGRDAPGTHPHFTPEQATCSPSATSLTLQPVTRLSLWDADHGHTGEPLYNNWPLSSCTTSSLNSYVHNLGIHHSDGQPSDRLESALHQGDRQLHSLSGQPALEPAFCFATPFLASTSTILRTGPPCPVLPSSSCTARSPANSGRAGHGGKCAFLMHFHLEFTDMEKPRILDRSSKLGPPIPPASTARPCTSPSCPRAYGM